MAVTTLRDEEFGEVIVNRSRTTRRLTLRVDARGNVRIGLPFYTPLYIAKNFLREQRDFVSKKLTELQQKQPYLEQGSLIGKSHTLAITHGVKPGSRLAGTQLIVTLPQDISAASPEGQKLLRTASRKALRTQAGAYLERRLAYLAQQHGFTYQNVRFSSATTRWGSCSSGGTISLNVALMHLPFELIDYVIIHELCHTKQMNHSARFWALVEAIAPDYKECRRQLRSFQPI